MAATHLTARGCAAARPKVGSDGKGVQSAFLDDDPKGLELRISAEGRKVWCFRYRTLGGRQRRLTLGVFAPGEDDPARSDDEGEARPLALKAARRAARQARAVVENGEDPAAEKRKAREAPRLRHSALSMIWLAPTWPRAIGVNGNLVAGGSAIAPLKMKRTFCGCTFARRSAAWP